MTEGRRYDPAGRAVLTALLYLPGGATTGELAALVGYARNTVAQRYSSLRYDQLIEPGDAHQRWRLTAEGRAVAEGLPQPAPGRAGPPPDRRIAGLTAAEKALVVEALGEMVLKYGGCGGELPEVRARREAFAALRLRFDAEPALPAEVLADENDAAAGEDLDDYGRDLDD